MVTSVSHGYGWVALFGCLVSQSTRKSIEFAVEDSESIMLEDTVHNACCGVDVLFARKEDVFVTVSVLAEDRVQLARQLRSVADSLRVRRRELRFAVGGGKPGQCSPSCLRLRHLTARSRQSCPGWSSRRFRLLFATTNIARFCVVFISHVT